MRSQLKNTTKIYYKSLLDTEVELVDTYGNYSGERTNTYSEQKPIRVVISTMSGNYSEEHSGIIYKYEMSIVVYKNNILKEGDLISIVSATPKFNYRVRKVFNNLNHNLCILDNIIG